MVGVWRVAGLDPAGIMTRGNWPAPGTGLRSLFRAHEDAWVRKKPRKRVSGVLKERVGVELRLGGLRSRGFRSRRGRSLSQNRDAAMRTVPLDEAVDEGEERVVGAGADVGARVVLGAALADDDVAGEDELAVVLLHAEALGNAALAVVAGSLSFFVCHGN